MRLTHSSFTQREVHFDFVPPCRCSNNLVFFCRYSPNYSDDVNICRCGSRIDAPSGDGRRSYVISVAATLASAQITPSAEHRMVSHRVQCTQPKHWTATGTTTVPAVANALLCTSSLQSAQIIRNGVWSACRPSSVRLCLCNKTWRKRSYQTLFYRFVIDGG